MGCAGRGCDWQPTFLTLLRNGLMLQGGRMPSARRAGHLLGGPWQRRPSPLCLHTGIAGLDNLNIHPAHLSSAELLICTTSWGPITPKYPSVIGYTATHTSIIYPPGLEIA